MNRPPAVDLLNLEPRSPQVSVNLQCPEQSGSFIMRVIELDQTQALRVMWFLDYDLSGVGQEGPFRQERVEETGTPRRAATLPAQVLAARLPAVGPHVLEAFVIEEDALSASSATVPEWRAMRDCQSEGFPADCVSTHPASFRWSVLISDEQCQ